MATLKTDWYEIDTENFKTVADVDEWIDNVGEEAEALCSNCTKGYSCQDSDRTPENHEHCIHSDEYEDLAVVINALIAYAFTLAA